MSIVILGREKKFQGLMKKPQIECIFKGVISEELSHLSKDEQRVEWRKFLQKFADNGNLKQEQVTKWGYPRYLKEDAEQPIEQKEVMEETTLKDESKVFEDGGGQLSLFSPKYELECVVEYDIFDFMEGE